VVHDPEVLRVGLPAFSRGYDSGEEDVMSPAQTFTAFVGHRRIASGSLSEIAPAFRAASEAGESHLLVFDDTAGRPVELDLLGSASKVAARIASAEATPTAGRGGQGWV
jgi:hypothetical protein